MVTKMYITWEWDDKDIKYQRPDEKHIEVEVDYFLRDKIMACAAEDVQKVINEILECNKWKHEKRNT